MAELLAPVGDFDTLKAAVQFGSDRVYLGGDSFNARQSAQNFSNEGLKAAIDYAKLRNVKVDFTLNTLIKDSEFQEAIDLAEYVYNLGADSIIVQDLGLARYIIKNLPDIAVHASTQMSIHNLLGVQKLEEMGFKQVVLSRELPLHEIEHICQNSNVDIEVFIHGAICISYSGQCLFSSIVGARSANRGRCAQPCRLPYQLFKQENFKDKDITNHEKNVSRDKGYLLSSKDLCGLDYIPSLIKAGVKTFKIEGRLKPPEYVGTVTRIYKKYMNLAESGEEYIVDEKDRKDLLLAFNRGGFSTGNFSNEPNTEYVFKEKPNNMGIYIGNISNIYAKKGLITLTTKEPLKIGDSFSVAREEHKYTISEMIDKNGNNLKMVKPNTSVTIGRVKGNLKLGDKIYKLSSNTSRNEIMEYAEKEHRKVKLLGEIEIHKGKPIEFTITSSPNETYTYYSMSSKVVSDDIPEKATTTPLQEDRVLKQLNKTTNTPFEFESIVVNMDDDIFLPKISSLNELRRRALDQFTTSAVRRFERYEYSNPVPSDVTSQLNTDLVHTAEQLLPKHVLKTKVFKSKKTNNKTQICLLLNNLRNDFTYTDLKNVDCLYIPVKYFADKEYEALLLKLSKKFNLYIELPTIIRDNYKNIVLNNIDRYVNTYNIKGIIITNIAGLSFAEKYKGQLEIIARYTLNVYNTSTINELKDAGVTRITLSPELDEQSLAGLDNLSILPTEFLFYGRLPLMNIGYCLLGGSNKCYPECSAQCRNTQNRYFLRDRLNYDFPLYPDHLQCVTTIYNSKITSIASEDFKPDYKLISILDEPIEQINYIIDHVIDNSPIEGNEFTTGNFNKYV